MHFLFVQIYSLIITAQKTVEVSIRPKSCLLPEKSSKSNLFVERKLELGQGQPFQTVSLALSKRRPLDHILDAGSSEIALT